MGRSLYERARLLGKAGFAEYRPRPTPPTTAELVSTVTEELTRLVDLDTFVKDNFDPHSDTVLADVSDAVVDATVTLRALGAGNSSLQSALELLYEDLILLLLMPLVQAPLTYPLLPIPDPPPPMELIREQVAALRVKYAAALARSEAADAAMTALETRLAAVSSSDFFKLLSDYLLAEWPGGVWPNPLPDPLGPPPAPPVPEAEAYSLDVSDPATIWPAEWGTVGTPFNGSYTGTPPPTLDHWIIIAAFFPEEPPTRPTLAPEDLNAYVEWGIGEGWGDGTFGNDGDFQLPFLSATPPTSCAYVLFIGVSTPDRIIDGPFTIADTFARIQAATVCLGFPGGQIPGWDNGWVRNLSDTEPCLFGSFIIVNGSPWGT